MRKKTIRAILYSLAIVAIIAVSVLNIKASETTSLSNNSDITLSDLNIGTQTASACTGPDDEELLRCMVDRDCSRTCNIAVQVQVGVRPDGTPIFEMQIQAVLVYGYESNCEWCLSRDSCSASQNIPCNAGDNCNPL